jgi:hypothetical protein
MAVRIESQSEPIAGYRLLDRLGSGGFGEVWRAEAPGGIYKAIKVIHGDLRNRDTDAYRFAEQELKSLKRVKQVRHPYLLALDRFDIVEGRLLIVMELADCNLWDRFRECRRNGLPGIPRDELLRYMAEAGEVLDLMNDQFQLQHLDIKPQNLFLLYNHVKVADFGQVKDLEGMVASVTGGITPVYAAPETFDGFVSRYCDQYSLACVYQELLTGDRPFDGTSMQQLLMQHLQMLPNLQPSPPCDRPALAKALAKKAEDRFPSVSAMVEALRGNLEPGSRVFLAGLPPPPAAPAPVVIEPAGPQALPSAAPDSTPGPRGVIDTPVPERLAPPEVTGPGPLRPTLVVGLGYTGLRVLQQFRKQAADRFGPADRTPLIRCLYVDTDPDAEAAAATDQSGAGLVALTPDQVLVTRLNRTGHYLKPRLNGRTLVEGWFDPQLLYRLPRTPTTMGLRALGRLAFCDHYRQLTQKIEIELDACLSPDAIGTTRTATDLELRTNQPRVYVVAGLGGGTGAGMFLDMAYAVRAQLRRIGYADPDVVGVLLVPPDAPAGELSVQAQANAYAALTELHHYCRPESVFSASYDDRVGFVRDAGPPFSDVVVFRGLPYPPPPPASGTVGGGSGVRSSGVTAAPATRTSGLVPGPALHRSGTVSQPPGRLSGSARQSPDRRASGTGAHEATRRPLELDGPDQDPSAAAAEFLRLDVFTGVGRTSDEARPGSTGNDPSVAVRSVGAVKFAWPRAEVVTRTARVIAPVLLSHWVSPDPTRVREVIPGWAEDLWGRLGLDPGRLTARLSAAADRAAGRRVADAITASIEPLIPRGWLPRVPDAEKVSQALDQWRRLVGRPAGAGPGPTPIEEALASVADGIAEEARREFAQLFPGLIETPLFRLAGTEEAIRQTVSLLDRTRTSFEQLAIEHDTAAAAAYEQLVAVANFQRGMRKVSAAEFADAVRTYPTARYENVMARSAVRVFRGIRDTLIELQKEVAGCRQRVDRCRPVLKAEADIPVGPSNFRNLLPPGCATVEEAAQHFLRSLTDDDLHELDVRVQAGLERTFGGLYQACLNTAEVTEGLLRIFREETRAYLDARLGEVDLAAMVARHFGSKAFTAEGFVKAYEAALPNLVPDGPWSRSGVAVFASPSGAGGDPIRELAVRVLPAATVFAESRDEVVLYREYPAVPLAALPQLGPTWAAAYRAAPDVQQCTAHSRLDVTKWIDVDAG